MAPTTFCNSEEEPDSLHQFMQMLNKIVFRFQAQQTTRLVNGLCCLNSNKSS